MRKAVNRIILAKEKGEEVVVYGDYDADGITSTVVLIEALSEIGLKPTFFIPDRMTEGYGLHEDALQKLHSAGADLIITVDCGIRAVEEANFAKSLGLEMIVTDHHAPGPSIPDVVAIINPKQEEDNYPFNGFAGVGLAYKLSQALMCVEGRSNLEHLLELVAIGTVADLAPLRDENRFLVAQGLERMNKTQRVGLKALMEIARVINKVITTDSIGFVLGPRINAVGRLEDAASAVELLLSKDINEAHGLAQKLDEVNRRRQKITTVIVEQARQLVYEKQHLSSVIFAAHEDFHEGIVGLAASRLSDEFFRPAIVATLGDDFTRGSARSIPGFNITHAFDECAHLLVQYGGHSAAAGFTVKTSELEQFKSHLENVSKETLASLDRQPTIEIDAEASFSEITSDLLAFVEMLQPCGIDNPAPMIGSKNIQVVSKRCVGKDKSHLKLMLKGNGKLFDAIAFRKGDLFDDLPEHIDLAYRIERNVYMGYESIQLNVQEIRW
jgi:single-stranded-DNA-specific exonuclease